jgi:glycosyltransferase involved in cell wall biosynthesis
MSCGVPIVGYDNEAFAGIVRESRCGWTSPIGNPHALAARVAQLADRRDVMASAARQAVEFAREHAFERTFARRSAHLVEYSRLPEKFKRQRRGPERRFEDTVLPSGPYALDTPIWPHISTTGAPDSANLGA